MSSWVTPIFVTSDRKQYNLQFATKCYKSKKEVVNKHIAFPCSLFHMYMCMIDNQNVVASNFLFLQFDSGLNHIQTVIAFHMVIAKRPL